jgi:hypothetical protein
MSPAESSERAPGPVLVVSPQERQLDDNADPLLAFSDEADLDHRPKHAPREAHVPLVPTRLPVARAARAQSVQLSVVAMAAIALCVGAGATTYLAIGRMARTKSAKATSGIEIGTLAVQSRAPGVEVTVDGIPRGKTPITISLPLGAHTLQVESASGVRRISLTIERGISFSQYLDVAPAGSAPSVGDLEVSSDDAGAEVRIDGVVRGKTPLTLHGMTTGSHKIIIGTGDTAVARTVSVSPDKTASIVASIKPVTPAQAAAGWVVFRSPIELEVMEGGHLIGTTGVERLMLPAGAHQLDFLSKSLEFRSTASVHVVSGKTSNAEVTIPNGSLSVNASPWADVTLDGREVGTTPLAGISVPIGTHEIVWRHPQLGERRRTVAVTAISPTRIGVDFSK